MKINGKTLTPKQEALIKRVKESLLTQKAILAKHGFDIKKHWAEMLKTTNK